MLIIKVIYFNSFTFSPLQISHYKKFFFFYFKSKVNIYHIQKAIAARDAAIIAEAATLMAPSKVEAHPTYMMKPSWVA